MEVIKMPRKLNIMRVIDLKNWLNDPERQIIDNFEVWLSSDEEGNVILPMIRNADFSIYIEKDENRITFFPAHC
jgi:hypothetical protein